MSSPRSLRREAQQETGRFTLSQQEFDIVVLIFKSTLEADFHYL